MKHFKTLMSCITTHKFKITVVILCCFAIISCERQGFLNRKPSNILTGNEVFSNPKLVKANLANLYNGIFQLWGLKQWWQLTQFDDVFPSKNNNYWRVKNKRYPYTKWNYWDYNYLHDINEFIERIRKADKLTTAERRHFLGEGQFLRALFYFKEVRIMGGVPLVLKTLKYNFSGNANYLYRARTPEYKIYNFIIAECDSAALRLPKNPKVKDWATWGAAMALKSRAALFAGSIAQHGVNTPTVTLPNNIVGIPASKADHYYKIALNAAQDIIKSNEYHLYMQYPDSLAKNFAYLFLDKTNNHEVIFAQNFKLKHKTTKFTVDNQPHSLEEEGHTVGCLNPSLNFVQSFERLNNTFAPFKIKNPNGTYKRYNTAGAIFKGRDARLAGTVILPGSKFRGEKVNIFAGYYLPQKPKGQRIITGSRFGQKKTLPGQSKPVQVVGKDGPIDGKQWGAQTGFYMRKYLDPTPGAGQTGVGSAVRWIRMRYAGVLLSTAESAFQLGKNALAANYINQVRARAGFKTPLKPAQITFKRIVHAWLTEFAFEGRLLYNMKRWRLATKIWDGGKTDLKHPGNPWAPSTKPWGLWPYKVYDPGKPDNGKWIYKRVLPSPAKSPDLFRLGNYYSRISNRVMAHNPKLIQNPNQ